MRLYLQSENPETGLFKSAYPSRFDFDMGSWSMAWIQSLHDYYFMRGDSVYVSQFTSYIDRVLGFYERHLDEKTGLIGTVRNQNFIDWSITDGNLPRRNENKEMVESALLSLYYAHTLDCVEKLYRQLNLEEKSNKYMQISQGIKKAIYTNCWDEEEQLFRDYADQQIYSQHTNPFTILCDFVDSATQIQLLNRILEYDKFDEMASFDSSFFLFKAMQKTGQEDLFLNNLNFWYTFLYKGPTTSGETGFMSHNRSDCHTWSAHPAYFLLSSVCGIKPADIGFNKVEIAPHLGGLKSITATMPHPFGNILVSYSRENGSLKASIFLPGKMEGEFIFNGMKKIQCAGENNINLKNQF